MDVLANREDDFDLQKFNVAFEKEKERKRKEQELRMKNKLERLNQSPPRKKLADYSVGELMIGIKDTWFEILDDTLQNKINKELFTKDDRLFFVGLTFFITVLSIFLYIYLFEEKNTPNQSYVIRHVYEIK